MTQPLASQIARTPGSPASVRIGKVASVSPWTVSVQGTVFEPSAVAVVGGLPLPGLGQPVALVGQSPSAGADPASWLVVPMQGSVSAANTATDYDATSVGTTSATYVALAPTVGVAFVAPPSGTVMVHWRANLFNSDATTTGGASPQIREGAVVGSGTIFVAGTIDRTLTLTGTSGIDFGASSPISTLTPGMSYNAEMVHRRFAGAGTAQFARREVTVVPA